MLQILIADVRLFSDDAEAGAGHVRKNRVHGVLPLRNGRGGVLQASAQDVYAQPLGASFNESQLVRMDIAGD